MFTRETVWLSWQWKIFPKCLLIHHLKSLQLLDFYFSELCLPIKRVYICSLFLRRSSTFTKFQFAVEKLYFWTSIWYFGHIKTVVYLVRMTSFRLQRCKIWTLQRIQTTPIIYEERICKLTVPLVAELSNKSSNFLSILVQSKLLFGKSFKIECKK